MMLHWPGRRRRGRSSVPVRVRPCCDAAHPPVLRCACPGPAQQTARARSRKLWKTKRGVCACIGHQCMCMGRSVSDPVRTGEKLLLLRRRVRSKESGALRLSATAAGLHGITDTGGNDGLATPKKRTASGWAGVHGRGGRTNGRQRGEPPPPHTSSSHQRGKGEDSRRIHSPWRLSVRRCGYNLILYTHRLAMPHVR